MITAEFKLSDQDVSTLRKMLKTQVERAIHGDWNAYVDHLTEDVVFMPPDEPLVEGRSAVRKYLNRFPKIHEFESNLVEAEGCEPLAVGRGTFRMKLEKEGKPVSLTGKWMAGYEKQPDESYRIKYDIWNFDTTTA